MRIRIQSPGDKSNNNNNNKSSKDKFVAAAAAVSCPLPMRIENLVMLPPLQESGGEGVRGTGDVYRIRFTERRRSSGQRRGGGGGEGRG